MMILGRELCVVARRARTYRHRCSLAIALLLAIGLSLALAYATSVGPVSVQEMAFYAQYVFAVLASIQVVLTIGLVPALLAGAIAQERERRTLEGLLTTRLSSAEIVLGKLFGGLVQYAGCLLSTLPIMILLSLCGGVDPRLVLLAHAGTAAVAFFMAGLSILVSTRERNTARALKQTIGLATAWFVLPGVLQVLVPRVSRLLWYWLKPFVDWWAASSPNSVAEALLRSGLGPMAFDAILWMIALQLALGSLLMAWSVVRLRRASRSLAEGEGARGGFAHVWLGLRRRLFGKPACGGDPVLWKEIHTARMPGLTEVLGLIISLAVVAAIGYGTYYFGRPAFTEMQSHGFGATTPQPRRTDFNRFLSHVSSWVEFFMLLIVAGVAANSVTLERARDTWDSLIATPLTGSQILRAKMIGTAWKVRPWAALLVFLWMLGLLSGSVHPVGFVIAVLLLGASIWFMAALGTYASLLSRDVAQASNRALVPALLLMGTFLSCYLPLRFPTILMGALSPPFINWVCLVSSGEIRAMLNGDATFRRIEHMNIYSHEGGLRVLVACLFSIAAFAGGAAWLTRAAFKRFDRVVGRPQRAIDHSRARSAAAQGDWWRKRAAPVAGSVLAGVRSR
jgi:ABC-type transport system involved in multi-copper enzyme maturation permease subunit